MSRPFWRSAIPSSRTLRPSLERLSSRISAVPDEENGLAFDHLTEAGKAVVQLVEAPIEDQDHGGREQAADQGHVLADHRVLDGVGDDEENDQVEGRELAGLPLADDAEEDDEDDVDDRRAERDATGGRSRGRGSSSAAMLVHRPSRYHRAVPATTALRAAPERALRTFLLWLSRRRSLGRLATRLPVTRSMVARFVAGETLDEALAALEKLRAAGLRTTVDVLGEAVASTDARGGRRRRVPRGRSTPSRPAASTATSASSSARWASASTTRSAGRTWSGSWAEPPSMEAFVRIDMEDHATTDATLALWRELRPLNAGRGDSGVVIQAALRRSPADVEALIAEGARIRLCKGAYVEPAVGRVPRQGGRRRGLRDADGAAPAATGRSRPSRPTTSG